MSPPGEPARNRRAVWWGLASLVMAAVLGVLLTWGVKALDRWGALPTPQSPAWYDCATAAKPFALQYALGSDHVALRWPAGETLRADSYPDRIVWRDVAQLDADSLAALPAAFRYQSAQRLELVTASGLPVDCVRRDAAADPSAS